MNKNSKKTKYSFILPIYNVDKYLEKCIDSILEQEYNNYEIILVDDESKDNCPIICDNYKKKDNRIKVIHKKNGGLCDARNTGLKIAKGEYILFVDPDDYIEKDYLNIIDENIKQGDMLIFSYYYLYKNKKYKGFSINKVLSNKEAQEYLVSDNKYCGYVWNKVYKKKLLDKYRIFFDLNVTVSEDLLFTFKYIEKINEVKVISSPLINYRQRKSSIISKKIKNIDAASLVRTYVYIINHSTHESVIKKCKSFYLKCYYKYNSRFQKNGFNMELIERIKNKDYKFFSKRDKKIILMYKYFPIIRPIFNLLKGFLYLKYD